MALTPDLVRKESKMPVPTHTEAAASAPAKTVSARPAGLFKTAREIVREAFALRRAMMKKYGTSEE